MSEEASSSDPPPRPTRPATSLYERFVNRISKDRFNDWYHERQTAENILNGQLYFNGLSPPPAASKHTPSKLLQCHRKIAYQRENAPREGASPEGLFWSGEHFEEDVIVPFLQDEVTTEDTYVQNSKWIDTTIDADPEELRLKGVTDPVIVTENGTPLLVTEVKTKSSIEYQDEPDRRHKAQLHAYLYALDEDYDRSINKGLLIYGSRSTFDLATFSVSFDPDFWDDVVAWMAEQTRYRDAGDLPPANPATDWECDYCSFRNRCGQTDVPYEDEGYSGLLPSFAGYRKQQMREYLEADEGAKLTPTLAQKYPELTRDFDVQEWVCSECGHTKSYDDASDPPDSESSPICPNCAKSDNSLSSMGIPLDPNQ